MIGVSKIDGDKGGSGEEQVACLGVAGGPYISEKSKMLGELVYIISSLLPEI